jgi:predicted nuclease of predicted toxin-antitoxin system
MKILIDQNISHRIIALLASLPFDFIHVKTVGLFDATDNHIYRFAKQNDIVAILTMDDDFQYIQLQEGVPPKIIWLRVGNCSTLVLSNIIIQHSENIATMLSDEESDGIEIWIN